MRNFKKWMLAAILICGTSVFMACSSNEDNPAPVPQPDLNLAEKIVGKWMVAELDGLACPTNLKAVVTFDSPAKAHGSLSDFYSESWNVDVEADVKIDGNKMIITAKEDDHITHVLNVIVSSITDEDMVLSSDWTVLVDGKEAHKEVYEEERWERVTEDYADAIIGTWEGQVTRDLGDDTNGEQHRWECKSDGTYAFYDKVNDEWKAVPNFLADYFVDGTLLCSRWQDTENSEELREWWEIESIKDGVMKGKALRQREDGTTYVATFEMTKVQEAIDYSQEANWYKLPEITKEFDTFYIYSTMYMGANDGDADYATLDNAEVLGSIWIEHAIKSSVFEESTNLFIPYYRQSSMKHAAEVFQKDGNIDAALIGMPYTDITAALDYYFENYNEGRPFVIAGHSQGSAILRLVLKKYFKEHPEYYKRMVAAYAIGYSITKEDLEANPHMKFATGETDTGVIISWHAEGPKNVEANVPIPSVIIAKNGIAINPLNWKRDETYAPTSENLGSIVMDEKTGKTEIRDIDGDAQVCLARGTVVTNAKAIPNEMTELAGPQCYHQDDYSIFYNNIKDNVAKRIAAYKTN